jgi:hypothetical protein
MSTTWGQYTWGSNSWESDLNTVTPSSNTISISTNDVSAFPLNGWGGQQWGANLWGNLTDNGAEVSGIQITTSLGSESVDGEINSGWGRQTWGINGWGILGTLQLQGNQINTAVQSVTVDAQIQLGWGGLYWGAGEWGELSSPEVQLTGQLINTTTDTVTIEANANVDVTGQQRSITTGDETAGTSVLVSLNPLTQLDIDTDGVFAGELVIVEVSSPANDEWGTEYWGAGQWGVGDGITIITGTETENTGTGSVTLTGEEINVTTDTLGQASIYSFTGEELNISTDGVFGGPNIEVQVRTASAVNWGYAPYGEGQWGQGVGTDIGIGGEEVATPSIEVPVNNTNLTINSFANNQPTITADANTLQTGEELTIVLGDEDAIPNTQVDVTGIELGPIVIGDYLAGISAEVTPTGVTATTSTGIIGLNAWAVVDPGTAPTWTVVDIAA